MYYFAGQELIVKAKYSDSNMIIHMQAIYEERDNAYRRPSVVNLELDASEDAAGSGTGRVDPDNGDFPSWLYGLSGFTWLVNPLRI